MQPSMHFHIHALSMRSHPCIFHAFITMHYPRIHNYALSMHSHPCIIHAFNLAIHKKHNHTSSMHYPCIMYSCIIHATILLSTRTQSCIVHAFTSMHYPCIHPYIVHAFTFILLFTRALMHYYPCIHNHAFSFMQYHSCIVIHLDIYKITSTL